LQRSVRRRQAGCEKLKTLAERADRAVRNPMLDRLNGRRLLDGMTHSRVRRGANACRQGQFEAVGVVQPGDERGKQNRRHEEA
jgi:hypothetical protein